MPTETSRYSVADIYQLPRDGQRYELLGGVLHVTPLARRRHQAVVALITYRLTEWARAHGGLAYPGVNVDLSDDTHLEPDVAYTRSEDTSGLALTQAPELVVEISSPSTRAFDLGPKKDRYATAGATEFWFVDLDDDTIDQYLLGDAGYAAPATHGRGDRFTSPLFDGLVLFVDELLGPPEQ